MINKWDIYYSDVNPIIDNEQRGTRPVLVVSNNAINGNLHICTVLPLSGVREGRKIFPTEVLLPISATNLPKLSVAMVQQVRTISHDRLTNFVGTLENEEIRQQILTALKEYFEY